MTKITGINGKRGEKMPDLRSIDFGKVRRLAQASKPFPSLDVSALYQFNPIPASSTIQNILDYGLIESRLEAQERDVERDLTQGQKQVQSLTERLQASGQEVPEPEAAGREGIVGTLLNWMGALPGAATTLVYDLVNDDDSFQPLQSLKEGFTGEDRKIGSDVLEELGVENDFLQAVGGFALDVLLDPLTYTGIGLTRSLGSQVVRERAAQALKRAGKTVKDEGELYKLIDETLGTNQKGQVQRKITNDERVAIIAQEFGRPVSETTEDGLVRQFQIAGNAAEQGKRQFTLYGTPVELPSEIDLRAGIPFTNRQKTLANITPMLERIRNAVRLRQNDPSTSRLFQQLNKYGQEASNFLKEKFRKYPIPSKLADLFKQRDTAVNSSYRRALLKAEEINKKLGGGFRKRPTMHSAIAYLLDHPERGRTLLQNLPKEDQKKALEVYKEVKNIFEKIAKEEKRYGILDEDKVRQFYFPHLITGDPQALRHARAVVNNQRRFRKFISTKGRHQQSRTASTLDNLDEFVENFNKSYEGPGKIEINFDIGQVVASRQLASEVLKQNKQLLDRLKAATPELIQPVKNVADNPNFVQLRGIEGFEGLAVHNDVADFIQNWDQISTPGPALNQFVNLVGNVNSIWKWGVTATPQHLFNNLLGSLWNNWLLGVKNPRDYFNAMTMLTSGKGRSLAPNRQVLENIEIPLPNGGTLNGFEIMQLADQYNIIRAGSEADVMGRRLDKVGNRSALMKGAASVQTGAEFIEDWARLAGFMNQIRETGDVYQAALNVKKHLFDYNELSNFERDILEPLIPFYAWMRKNIPLQLEYLIRRPGMFTGIEHAIAESSAYTGVNIEEMPGYIANALTLPLWQTEEGNVVYLSPYALPANDLFEVLQSLDSLPDFGAYLGQLLNPFIRIFAEIPANMQFYSQIPIDTDAARLGQEPDAESIINYLFRQTGLPYNIARSLGRETIFPTGEEQDAENEFVSRTVGGGGPFTITNLFGLTGSREYNPEYWTQEVLPYIYADQLRGEISDLAEEGETVYTQSEIEQAEELGLSLQQVRILRGILEQRGMRKTKENIWQLYQQLTNN